MPKSETKVPQYESVSTVKSNTSQYENPSKVDVEDHKYDNVPKSETKSPQYDNVPKSAKKLPQYDNVPTSVTGSRQDVNLQTYNAFVPTSDPLNSVQHNEYKTLPALQSGVRPDQYGGEGVIRPHEYGGEIPKENK